MWTKKNDRRWERSDGAVVLYRQTTPDPNPTNPRCRMWMAYEPSPSEAYLIMRRGRIRQAQDGHDYQPGFPRRWNTAEAAMKTVDSEYPLNPQQ